MQPLVSVVLSTYNRPETLGLAIASVQAQSLEDWELLIIGDACDADTGELIATLDDPRIHYINLMHNFGEQSGPNNLGIARARGRYIALLNHDDLWLPDHLQAALEWLQATGADLVFPLTAVVMPSTTEQLEQHRWRTHLHGLGRDGHFDPVDTFAPASSWLMRREAAERVGPWKPAADCITESSRELLFRAWRLGMDLRALPWISVLAFHSGLREAAYVKREAHEQRWFWEQVRQNPTLRQQLLARAGNAENPPRPRWQRILFRLLAELGVFPAAVEYRARGLGKGQLIRRLRERRGLTAQGDRFGNLNVIRNRTLHSIPPYRLGDHICFLAAGNATAFQSRGWSYPEPWGTWTDGAEAELHLKLESPVQGGLLLEIEGQCFLTEQCQAQRVSVHLGETWLGEWIFEQQNNHGLHSLRIPPELISGPDLRLRLLLPDAHAPSALSQEGDSRQLGLALVFLRLSPEPPVHQG
jgi:glycosyltransferase involved in cell wall biosynthesis